MSHIVLEVEYKHTTKLYYIKDTAQLHRTALHIVRARFDGLWYLPEDDDYDRIKALVENHNDPMAGKMAWDLLRARSLQGHKYEKVAFRDLKEI